MGTAADAPVFTARSLHPEAVVFNESMPCFPLKKICLLCGFFPLPVIKSLLQAFPIAILFPVQPAVDRFSALLSGMQPDLLLLLQHQKDISASAKRQTHLRV